jgi:hypothetical protein
MGGGPIKVWVACNQTAHPLKVQLMKKPPPPKRNGGKIKFFKR